WVYRPGSGLELADPSAQLRAVQAGTRLFSSPDRPGELAGWAIARPEQIDHSARRWDDGWVRELDEAQVDRYALLFERLIERARAVHGSAEAMDPSGAAGDAERSGTMVCEVLSTWPHPLRRVMER